jgi:hypothetical protein
VNQPSKKDRLRPVELLVLAAIMGVFTGLVVLMASREWLLAVVFFGVAFIVALVVLAMFALTFKPNEAERHEIEEADGTRREVIDGPIMDGALDGRPAAAPAETAPAPAAEERRPDPGPDLPRGH